jgi:hypothetical protein
MNDQPTIQLPPLDVGAVNLLLEGLGKLPLERSLPLFQAIQHEAQQQLAPPPPAATKRRKAASGPEAT